MILLLTGSSETARGLIVDKILDENKQWKHLALEDLHEEGEWNEEEIGMDDLFGTMVACECANDEAKKGHDIVITCPVLSLVDTVLDAFPKKVVSVYMGTDRRLSGAFDHAIDPNKMSVNSTYVMIKKKVMRRK